MNQEIVNKFKNGFFTKKIHSLRGIGIECEFPIVTKKGKAVSLSIIQSLFIYLNEQGFEIERDNYSNLIIAAKRINIESLGHFEFCADTITTDTAYSTLEIVLAPQNNLHSTNESLSSLLDILIPFFDRKNCLLLGYGIQPLTAPSRKLLMPKERYLFFEKLSTNKTIPKSEGADSSLLNITASNQCHIEIGLENAIPATNVLNALSGLQIILHANSPIWEGQVDPVYKANREMFWDICYPDRLNQIGIPPKFEDIESYVDLLLKFKPLLVKREGHYLQILNKKTFEDFLLDETPTIGSTLTDKQVIIQPKIDDIQQLIPFSWFNARLVPKYGTIESRMCCQQPQGENLTTAALTLGIIENLQAAEKLTRLYSLNVWRKLRTQAAEHTFNTQIKGNSVLPLLRQLLDLAKEGLENRGFEEEVFLEPLYKRLEEQQSPADLAIEVFNTGGLEALLKHASFKKEIANKSIPTLKPSSLILK